MACCSLLSYLPTGLGAGWGGASGPPPRDRREENPPPEHLSAGGCAALSSSHVLGGPSAWLGFNRFQPESSCVSPACLATAQRAPCSARPGLAFHPDGFLPWAGFRHGTSSPRV